MLVNVLFTSIKTNIYLCVWQRGESESAGLPIPNTQTYTTYFIYSRTWDLGIYYSRITEKTNLNVSNPQNNPPLHIECMLTALL